MTSRPFAAQAAQVTAQTLTAWALMISFFLRRPEVFTVAFAATAFLVPLRHDGTSRGRALTCFSASLALASVIGWTLVTGLLGGGVTTESWMLLTATVLFSLAGGLHWLRRDEGDGGAGAGAGS